jgi:pyruvate dehydrogenase E2 component (dihydrolipoamide acetyltransferase)
MIREIYMPRLSSTMTEGKIVSWSKSTGDKVNKGETLLIVESDKADMDVECFYEGYLGAIIIETGQEAPVDTVIGFIAETEAEIEEAKKRAASSGTSSPAPAQTTSEPAPVAAAVAAEANNIVRTNGRTVVSPRARKLAKDLKVDLKTLQGSGPHGRIVAQDVEKAAGISSAAPAIPEGIAPLHAQPQVAFTAPSAPVAATPVPTPAPVVPGETVPLTTFQKAVVQNMMATLQVPVFRVSYTITTDGLDKLYKQIKSKGVTMTALLAKAIAVTLKNHPLVNASYSDRGVHYNSAINVAVAVAMPDGGLITPVLKNADRMDIYSLSRAWKDLVDRARAKQLQPDEYSTGTFTLSNLGMFGVDSFDAILPPGQGSILAVGASRPQVMATGDGMFGVKSQMTVNITSDHRIIYGAHAAAFLQDLAKLIETDVQSLTL